MASFNGTESIRYDGVETKEFISVIESGLIIQANNDGQLVLRAFRVTTVFPTDSDKFEKNAVEFHSESCQKCFTEYGLNAKCSNFPAFYYAGYRDDFKLGYMQSSWVLEKKDFDNWLERFKNVSVNKDSNSNTITNTLLNFLCNCWCFEKQRSN